MLSGQPATTGDTPTQRGTPLTIVQPVDRSLALRFAECRAMGHEWHHEKKPLSTEDLGYREPLGVEYGSVAFRSTCNECTTVRIKWMGRRGTLYPPQYHYPDGYQRRGEDERMTLSEWRQAWVVNVLGE